MRSEATGDLVGDHEVLATRGEHTWFSVAAARAARRRSSAADHGNCALLRGAWAAAKEQAALGSCSGSKQELGERYDCSVDRSAGREHPGLCPTFQMPSRWNLNPLAHPSPSPPPPLRWHFIPHPLQPGASGEILLPASWDVARGDQDLRADCQRGGFDLLAPLRSSPRQGPVPVLSFYLRLGLFGLSSLVSPGASPLQC